MISGKTKLIAHIGYPIETFKAPLIYNPWFSKKEIDAIVMPMGIKLEDFTDSFRSVFRFSNIHGALITMPHKVNVIQHVDELTVTAKIAGSANAVLKKTDGSLLGDMFDGTGFTRGLRRKGFEFKKASCLVVGAGGVGSAIAASLAAENVKAISLYDTNATMAGGLAERLKSHYPQIDVSLATNDPAGYSLVVNATPLGMNVGDPLPFDVSRVDKSTFIGEVVMKQEITPMLKAVKDRGCRFQVGTDMLFEMIPAYLEFFGFGTSTPEELRSVAQINY